MKPDTHSKPPVVRVRTQLRAGLTWTSMKYEWSKSVARAASMSGMTSETEVVE